MENPVTENQPGRRPRRFPALALILALSAVLNLTGIWWGLPTNHSWAPDELFPRRVIAGLENGFAHGWYDRYPPVHYYLLSLLYAPFLASGLASVPEGAPPAAGLLLYYLGRLLSVLMAAGCLVLVYKTGREVLDRRAALFASLITALVAPFPYYAKTVHLDVPYLFWFLWSVYFFVRLAKTQRLKYYLLFALTAALSICTKDQAYGLYVAAPALIIWADRRAERAAGRPRPFFSSLLKTRYLSLAAVAAGMFALGHNLFFNWSGFMAHLKFLLGPTIGDYRMFPGTVSGQVRLLGLTVKEIGFCLGFPLFIVCLLGLGLALRQRSRNFNLLALSLFGLSYYVFYIAVIGYNYDRFNLPVCVLLAFFGGKALSDLMALPPPWPTVTQAAAALALVTSFSLAASVDILMVKDSRYRIEGWLQANVPSGTKIGFVGLPNYLPRLDGYARRPISPNLGEFERSALPEFIVLNVDHASRFPADSEEGRFFRGFPEAGPGYSLVYRYQAPLGWLPLRPSPAFSSLAQINPEIEVYIKGAPPP